MSQDSKKGNFELLESLEAQIESLRGRSDVALQQLVGRSDPSSVRRRLAILIEAEKLNDAAVEIRSLEMSESWVDLGSFALAGIGDFEEAKRFVNWASTKSDLNLTHRTAVMFFDGAWQWAFRDRSKERSIVPGSISESEKEVLSNISQVIGPICDDALMRRAVQTEVESQLLQRYLDLLYLLGDRRNAPQVFELLLTRKPIPIKLGQAILQGVGKATNDLIARLWNEHPESFTARFLACVIQSHELEGRRTAEERLKTLVDKAQSKEQREQLCGLMYELSKPGDVEQFRKIQEVTEKLLGTDSFLFTIFQAYELLRAEKQNEALNILESVRSESDPRWLKAFADAKTAAGEKAEAFELLKRLGAMAPSVEVFRVISHLSEEEGRIDEKQIALEQTLALDPENLPARWQLAMLFADGKEYLNAAKQFEILRTIRPDDETVIANLAVSYYFAVELDHALSVLVPKPGETTLPLALLKTRAHILEAAGRAGEAFSELATVSSTHWEEPEYLLAYMQLAYATGREKEANDALTKLRELHQRGVVDEKIVRPASLEDIRQWMEGAAKRHDETRRNLLQGMMPWITAAQLQGEVPLWSWFLKTQSMNWVWDDPLNRATYSVFSTNSFRVLQKGESSSTLEVISCPPRGTPVVVDLSALVTLHELGLLNQALEYFEVVYIPAVYLSKVADDTRKLLPHQRSQKDAALKIGSLVADGRIVALKETHSDGDLILVDEYADAIEKGRVAFRLLQLFETMHEAGMLSDDQMERAKLVAHKSAEPIEGQHKLTIGSRLEIGELTLVTLHRLGLLDTIAKEFAVHISKSNYDEVTARIRAFEALEEARIKHTELWGSLRNDKRVRFTSVKTPLEIESEKREWSDLALGAVIMAKERNLPLLADDRVCQALVLNDRKDDKTAACGTDSLIIALLEAGFIEALDAARLLLQLMKWRYRFILMPPAAMNALAALYRTHPPGDALRQIAKYVHDCMRDPGLFSGFEPTTPPISIAIRLFQNWVRNVSELVIDIWADPTISESYAEEFTSWAMTELLPSPPRVLEERMQATISSLTSQTVMTTALIRGSHFSQFERINRGLRSMATALGLDEAEYLESVLKVTNGKND